MKSIPLTQGKFAIVDDEDFEWLNRWKWGVSAYGYAYRSDTSKQVVYMHKAIMNALPIVRVDHKNNDKLDNRRANLRICTVSQNGMNSFVSKNNKSGYKGVTPFRGKWRASIWTGGLHKNGGKGLHLGCFNTPEDAARAYDDAAIMHFGEFARLNFPSASSSPR